jgi:hypothetical protein
LAAVPEIQSHACPKDSVKSRAKYLEETLAEHLAMQVNQEPHQVVSEEVWLLLGSGVE